MRGFLLLTCLFFFAAGAVANDTTLPFYKEIRTFRQADSLVFPAPRQILFIGSSSFTKWKDVGAYFPGHRILNRGFGGSALTDLIRYRYEVIYPYDPCQIVIYCGENDFAASDTVTVSMVVSRFKQLIALIRARYPKVPVAYVSMKPSTARRKLLPKYVEANQLIKKYLASLPATQYVDVYQLMLNAAGQPNGRLFGSDSLHMNANGYTLWQKALKPVLRKK
jgi:lysophospholipase L1-like esterase